MVKLSNMQVITWTELIVAIAIGAVIWYGYVLLKYYRTAFSKRRQPQTGPVKWRRETDPASPGDVHARVHELMQEIKEVFAAAVQEQIDKEQVSEALGHRFSKYSHLPADIRTSITQHVLNEFSLQLKLSISEHEINALW